MTLKKLLYNLLNFIFMTNLLFVNQNLKREDDIEKAVAIVAFFQENEMTDEGCLEGLNINHKLINIAFLAPIGHNLSLHESLELQKQWQKEHYPQYHSTLISKSFSLMAKKYGLNAFDKCWTRSRWDEGYPQYRTHPEAAWPYSIDADDVLPNVYVSLVMNEEDFIKINPNILLDKYILRPY